MASLINLVRSAIDSVDNEITTAVSHNGKAKGSVEQAATSNPAEFRPELEAPLPYPAATPLTTPANTPRKPKTSTQQQVPMRTVAPLYHCLSFSIKAKCRRRPRLAGANTGDTETATTSKCYTVNMIYALCRPYSLRPQSLRSAPVAATPAQPPSEAPKTGTKAAFVDTATRDELVAYIHKQTALLKKTKAKYDGLYGSHNNNKMTCFTELAAQLSSREAAPSQQAIDVKSR